MLSSTLIDIGEQATYAQLAAGEINDFYQAANVNSTPTPLSPTGLGAGSWSSRPATQQSLRLWQMLVDDSEQYYNASCTRGCTSRSPTPTRPESFYNPMLDDVCRRP